MFMQRKNEELYTLLGRRICAHVQSYQRSYRHTEFVVRTVLNSRVVR